MTIKNANIGNDKNLMRSTISNKYKFISIFFSILRKIGGGNRFSNLIYYIENEIFCIKKNKKKKLFLLDYGCGKMDFSNFLIRKKLIHKAIGVDNYELNDKNYINRKCRYVNISNKKNILNKKQFDVAIVIDVLHHIGIDRCHIEMKKICNISKYVIIKDHFEYGYLSRQILRFGDWFGNFGTDVNIPRKYFTEIKWNKLLKKLKLNQIKIIKNINQHKGLFSLILTPKHQFISIIKNKI
jgi:hypothetical protein